MPLSLTCPVHYCAASLAIVYCYYSRANKQHVDDDDDALIHKWTDYKQYLLHSA